MIFIIFTIFILINSIIFMILGVEDILSIFLSSLLIACNEILFIFIGFKKIAQIYLLIVKYPKIVSDNENKFLYFRELLTKYSISELGMIYNSSISSKVLLALELTDLIKQDKIKIENDNLIIIEKENLNYYQKYLLDTIRFIDTVEFQTNYKKKIKIELKKKSIFNKYDLVFDFLDIFIYAFLFIFVTVFVLFAGISIPLLVSVLLFIPYWSGLIIILSSFEKNSVSIRTKKGQEIYLKLVGLKKYLNDFKNFDEKHLEEIELWGDYILYAVILKESLQIEEEVLELFEKISTIIQNGKIKE